MPVCVNVLKAKWNSVVTQMIELVVENEALLVCLTMMDLLLRFVSLRCVSLSTNYFPSILNCQKERSKRIFFMFGQRQHNLCCSYMQDFASGWQLRIALIWYFKCYLVMTVLDHWLFLAFWMTRCSLKTGMWLLTCHSRSIINIFCTRNSFQGNLHC